MKKYRGETVETENNLRRAHKIHLLIHPGFVTLGAEIDNDRELMIAGTQQLQKYLAQAKRLKDKPNELLFAFVPGRKLTAKAGHITLKSDTKRGVPYLSILRQMKNTLGPRMIAIKDELGASSQTIAETDLSFGNEREVQKIFQNLKKLAEIRGFTFDQTTFLEAYGEYKEDCVQTGAENFRRAGKFKNPPVINSELSFSKPPLK